jgi:chemotaxis protein histidine kinase CheA
MPQRSSNSNSNSNKRSSSRNDETDDEVLARVLQEEYEAEHRRMQARRREEQEERLRQQALHTQRHHEAIQRQRQQQRQAAPPQQQQEPEYEVYYQPQQYERQQAMQAPKRPAQRPPSRPTSRPQERPQERAPSRPQQFSQQRAQSDAQVVDCDELLARRIAAEETAKHRQQQQQQHKQQQQQPQQPSNVFTPTTSHLSVSSDGSGANNGITDVEFATRLQQELEDERIAQSLAQREQERYSQRRAQQMSPAPPQRRGCMRTCCGYFVPLFVILAAAAGAIYWFGLEGNDPPNWIPSPQDFSNEDPFNAVRPQDADRWRTFGRGLTLDVLNSLDERWYGFFDTAISQWDAGTPDALTISTSVRTPEIACEPVQGKMKVCNGNYGDTRWRGINQVLLTNGFIVSSSAKMNEYYLYESSDDQKQYTMCHEIGHGFGLPHTDESFTNKDLGNCMDYTNNPGVNKQPGAANYEFLADLYGTVDGSTWIPTTPVATDAPASASSSTTTSTNAGQTQAPGEVAGTLAPSNVAYTQQPGFGAQTLSPTFSSQPPVYASEAQSMEGDNHGGGPPDGGPQGGGPGNGPHGRRLRSRRRVRTSEFDAEVGNVGDVVDEVDDSDGDIPAWVMASWKAASLKIEAAESVGKKSVHGWRMLHQTEYGEVHEMDLGFGYTLRAHKLLVTGEDDA